MKKYIPNILTTYRLIVAIILPVLFCSKMYKILFTNLIIALLTDALDGTLARHWQVTSNYGKIVDAIGDKILAFSSSIIFIISTNKLFFITLILEITIATINIINILKTHDIKEKFSNHKSSKCGKIKTIFLFILLGVSGLSFKFSNLNIIITSLIFATAIMQILTAIDYAKKDQLKN